MYFLALAIAVLASTGYHLSTRFIPHTVNPALSLLVTYGVAFAVSALLLLVVFPIDNLQAEVAKLTPASALVGLAVIGIEVGFILAYRAGWNISSASLVANLVVALLLLALGTGLFKETLTPVNMLGVLLCVLGLVLVNVKG